MPETIEALHEAGVAVWVLTGDKLETAVNIAYACRLLSNSHARVTITAEGLEGLEAAEQGGDAEAARRVVKEGVLRQLTEALAAHTFAKAEDDDEDDDDGGYGDLLFARKAALASRGRGSVAWSAKSGFRADTVAVSHGDLLPDGQGAAGEGGKGGRSGRFLSAFSAGAASAAASGSSRLSRRHGGPLALTIEGRASRPISISSPLPALLQRYCMPCIPLGPDFSSSAVASC